MLFIGGQVSNLFVELTTIVVYVSSKLQNKSTAYAKECCIGVSAVYDVCSVQ